MTDKPFTNAAGAPVADNTNIMTAGRRGPALLHDIWLIEKLAHRMRRIAGIRWWAWYNYLESRRDWVLTPLSTPGQNLPCPPTPTIRFSRFRCQVSAGRKSLRPSMPVRSVPTAASCCWLVPTNALA